MLKWPTPWRVSCSVAEIWVSWNYQSIHAGSMLVTHHWLNHSNSTLHGATWCRFILAYDGIKLSKTIVGIIMPITFLKNQPNPNPLGFGWGISSRENHIFPINSWNDGFSVGKITGWWFEPLWKILGNWDDDIPNIWENKIHGNQTTNQHSSPPLMDSTSIPSLDTPSDSPLPLQNQARSPHETIQQGAQQIRSIRVQLVDDLWMPPKQLITASAWPGSRLDHRSRMV